MPYIAGDKYLTIAQAARAGMNPDLADHLAALEKVIARVSAQEAPAVIGQLERLKTILLARMMKADMNTNGQLAATAEDLRHLSVPQVAALLDLPKVRVYELIRRGELPAVRLGEKNLRVPLGLLGKSLAQKGLDKPVYQRYTTPRDGRRSPAIPTAPSAHAGATRRAGGRYRDHRGSVGAGGARDLGAGGPARPVPGEDGVGEGS